MDRFGVSIKGILVVDQKLLLRKNERHEYELLGGRLEKDDYSAESRLAKEFDEESGIQVTVLEQREPWLYEIGLKNIIIIPYACEATIVPDILSDDDGGTLHWVDLSAVSAAFMPQGYKDTVVGEIPHKSYSIPAKSFFKIIPNYVDRDYFIQIRVMAATTNILNMPLPHFHSPRDFIYNQLGEKYKDTLLVSAPIGIDLSNDTIILNYTVSLPQQP